MSDFGVFLTLTKLIQNLSHHKRWTQKLNQIQPMSTSPGPRWEVQRWKGPIPPWIWQVFLPWPAQQQLQHSFFFAGASYCQVNPSALARARWLGYSRLTILITVNTNVKYIGNGMGMAFKYHVNWAKAVLKASSETKPCMTLCEFAWAQVTMILFCGNCWPAPSHLWNRRDSTASGPGTATSITSTKNTGNTYLWYRYLVTFTSTLPPPSGQVIGVVRKPMDMVNNLRTSKLKISGKNISTNPSTEVVARYPRHLLRKYNSKSRKITMNMQTSYQELLESWSVVPVCFICLSNLENKPVASTGAIQL